MAPSRDLVFTSVVTILTVAACTAGSQSGITQAVTEAASPSPLQHTPASSDTPAPLPSPYASVTPGTPDQAWNIYSPDPGHLWNRLYRLFYRRIAPDGSEIGRNSLDPPLWWDTTYLLEGESHQQAVQLLDEFLSSRGETLITDPLKRALFQRDMWAVFDWAARPSTDYPNNRRALERRLAQVIRRVALSRTEIEALPDNYGLAASSLSFPAQFLAGAPDQNFLPPPLFDADGEWLCLGREGGPLAMAHTESFPFFGRSAFLVFLRVTGGREAARQFVQGLNSGSLTVIPSATEVDVALVRRLLLVDDQNEIVLSPLVESVQIRHYAFGTGGVRGLYFYRFTLHRDLLLAGTAGGLQPNDRELRLFSSFGDPVRFGVDEDTVPDSCADCHTGGFRVASILSYSRERFPLPDQQQPVLTETTPAGEAQAVMAWKLKDPGWLLLKAFLDTSVPQAPGG